MGVWGEGAKGKTMYNIKQTIYTKLRRVGMNHFHKRLPMVVAGLALMVVFSGTAFPADLSLLTPGKTRSGTIANMVPNRKGLPVTREVTAQVMEINGDAAKVRVTWTKLSNGNGFAGSGEFVSPIVATEFGELRLQGCTNEGKREWKLTFKPDGRVSCIMLFPYAMEKKWGDLN
jgi:hypothetical protein